MHLSRLLLCAGLAAPLSTLPSLARAQEALPKEKPQEVRYAPVRPPNVPGVIMLFSGKQEDVEANWRKNKTQQPATWVVRKGALIAKGGDICTKQDFKDFYLHVEYRTPFEPGSKDQARGNSGIGLQAHYEIQVLNSYGYAAPGKGDAGAVYNQAAALINASRPPLNWQTYDIIFRAPRFDADGKRTEKARVTVLQNGIVVQNNTEIEGPTGVTGDRRVEEPGPIYLQDHGHAVEYRNIWILPLPEHGSDRYESH